MSNRQLQRSQAKAQLKQLKKQKQLPKHITLSQWTQSQKLTAAMQARFNTLKTLEKERVHASLDADKNKAIEDMFFTSQDELEEVEMIDVEVD